MKQHEERSISHKQRGHYIVPEVNRGYIVLQHRIIIVSTPKGASGSRVIEMMNEEFTVEPESW